MGITKKTVQRVYLGIDPGKSGAACALTSTRSVQPNILKFTEDYYEFDAWLKGLRKKYPSADFFICVEKVAGQTGPIQGRVSPRSMFTFGFHAGFVQGIVCGRREPLAEVRPVTWQSEFGLLRKTKLKGTKEKDADKKRRHLKEAKKQFPKAHIIQQTADGVLLALYCRRHYKELF